MQPSTTSTAHITNQQECNRPFTSTISQIEAQPKAATRPLSYTEDEADEQDFRSLAVTCISVPGVFLLVLAFIVWACS